MGALLAVGILNSVISAESVILATLLFKNSTNHMVPSWPAACREELKLGHLEVTV
jgi:hypothetical protein